MMSFPTLLANSLIGFLLVFLVLLVLMIFIALMNKVFSVKKETASADVAAATVPVPTVAKKEIPEVILTDVSDRDAAMIMAIVADESGIPLEELRFISIREVK